MWCDVCLPVFAWVSMCLHASVEHTVIETVLSLTVLDRREKRTI